MGPKMSHSRFMGPRVSARRWHLTRGTAGPPRAEGPIYQFSAKGSSSSSCSPDERDARHVGTRNSSARKATLNARAHGAGAALVGSSVCSFGAYLLKRGSTEVSTSKPSCTARSSWGASAWSPELADPVPRLEARGTDAGLELPVFPDAHAKGPRCPTDRPPAAILSVCFILGVPASSVRRSSRGTRVGGAEPTRRAPLQ